MIGCMIRCNTSSGNIGQNAAYQRSECCGLQCLDNCWDRRMQDTRVNTSCNDSVDTTCFDGSLPRQDISLMRIMPYDMFAVHASTATNITNSTHAESTATFASNYQNVTGSSNDGLVSSELVAGAASEYLEKELVFEALVAAVLSPPCFQYSSPWTCQTWTNGSMVYNKTLLGGSESRRLAGRTVVPIDILSGQATFTDLRLVNCQPGEYKILFYISNATVTHFQGRTSRMTGFQTPDGFPDRPPKFLATNSWPMMNKTIQHTATGSCC